MQICTTCPSPGGGCKRRQRCSNNSKVVAAIIMIIAIGVSVLVSDESNNDLYFLTVVTASSSVYQIDGSGITDVQECIWDIMHRMEVSASVPIRLTYRGLITTQTGTDEPVTATQYAKTEFLESILLKLEEAGMGNATAQNISSSLPMFVAVDYPLSTVQYDGQFTNYGIAAPMDGQANDKLNTSNIVQIPVLASPVSFFHSVSQTHIPTGLDTDDASVQLGDGIVARPPDNPERQDDADDDMLETETLDEIESIYMDNAAIDLYLDPCTIARIYTGKVTMWKDILAVQPNPVVEFNANPDKELDTVIDTIIPYAIRGQSSATLAVTTYLYEQCPEEFPQSMVTDNASAVFTVPDLVKYVNTFDEMISSLTENSGSIGYMPSIRTSYKSLIRKNNGNDDIMYLQSSVQEVFLKITDTDDQYYSSGDSLANTEGVASTIVRSMFPKNATDDYNNTMLFTSSLLKSSSGIPTTDLINNPGLEADVGTGTAAWPMFIITFLMVPVDLTYLIPDPVERSLLYAFLESFFQEDYIKVCQNKYNFASLPSEVKDFAVEGIDAIRLNSINYDNVTNKKPLDWVFESKDMSSEDIVDLRLNPYVLSSKRESYMTNIQDDLNDRVNDLTSTIEDTTLSLAIIEEELTNLASKTSQRKKIKNKNVADQMPYLSNEETVQILLDLDSRLTTATTLSSISFTAWMLVACYFIGKCLLRKYPLSKRLGRNNTNSGVSITRNDDNWTIGDIPDGMENNTTTTPTANKSKKSFGTSCRRNRSVVDGFDESSISSASPTINTTNSSTKKMKKDDIDNDDDHVDAEYGISSSNGSTAIL